MKYFYKKILMCSLVKIVHSYWTFLTLIMIALVALNAIHGKVYGKIFRVNDLRISLFGIIFSQIQLLIGLILYFISPWFEKWSSMGMGVIKNEESRFYLVQYPITNILAIILITIGWSLHKRQSDSSKKFTRIAIFYGFGFVFLIRLIF